MNENISRNVYSIKFDDTLQYCIIKFWPDKGNSENQIESTWYYTIVEIPLLRIYGGVPEKCEIKPTESLENSIYFNIEDKYKPATFEGLDYNCVKRGMFWSLKKSNLTLEEIIIFLREIFPSAESEFKDIMRNTLTRNEQCGNFMIFKPC